jgi:hypothetical protein
MLDTTIKILIPDRLGALAIPHVERSETTTPTILVIIIDLAKCKNDIEIVTTLAHQMSHAHCYLTTGRADIHGKNWLPLATTYAQALGIEEIAHRKREPCFQVLNYLQIFNQP